MIPGWRRVVEFSNSVVAKARRSPRTPIDIGPFVNLFPKWPHPLGNLFDVSKTVTFHMDLGLASNSGIRISPSLLIALRDGNEFLFFPLSFSRLYPLLPTSISTEVAPSSLLLVHLIEGYTTP
jgi:hypothetical protein